MSAPLQGISPPKAPIHSKCATRQRIMLSSAATLLLSMAFPSPTLAQASLASEDIVDDLQVEVAGTKETYTVIRDAVRREQFYVMPKTVRLYERTVRSKEEPEFALLRHQFDDPSAPGGKVEVGSLVFAITLAPPEGVQSELKKQIIARIADLKRAKPDVVQDVHPQEIRLAALPLKSSQVTVFAKNKKYLQSPVLGDGIGPTHASQKMVFSMDLTNVGADYYDALIRTDAGVPIRFQFTYLGLTPPAGFEVEVDMQKVYEQYSNNAELRARASYWGLVTADARYSSQVMHELKASTGGITVRNITNQEIDMSKVDQHLQTVLKAINDEILQDMKYPTQVDPAKAKEPDAKGFFGGAGIAVAVKDIKQVTLIKKTFKFYQQALVERKTIADGTIGLAKYAKDDELMKRLVVDVPPGFKSAYFLLPPVGDQLGIKLATFEYALYDGKDAGLAKTAVWTPATGWTYDDTPVTGIPLLLSGLPKEFQGKKLQDLQLLVKTTVELETGQSFETEKQPVELVNGRRYVNSLLRNVDVVMVDGSFLPWKMVDPNGKLVAVDIAFKSGDTTLRTQLPMRVKRKENSYSPPDPMVFLFNAHPSRPVPITATITYKFQGRAPLQWEYNDRDLRQAGLGLSVILDPTRWPKPEAPK